MIEVKPEHLHLDRAHLHQANFQQASLMDLYASECGKQQNKVDRLKNELEYKSAQKKIEIRANAEAQKIKMTQDQVDCALIVDTEIKFLKDNILDEEEYLAQLKAAVEGLRHKRDSINNEYRLIISKADVIVNGDVDPDIRFKAQAEAIQDSINQSIKNS